MIEKEFSLSDSIEPVDFFGIHNKYIDLIKKYTPNIKLVARGTQIKIFGDSNELNDFEKKMNQLISHYDKYNSIDEKVIQQIFENTYKQIQQNTELSDVIVFGNNGKIIRAQTPNQKEMAKQIQKNDLVFAIGPAGTGKTYTAVALAVQALKNKYVSRIVLTRPAVEAGESLGFLPGDYKEKLDPYLRPLYDALNDMIPVAKLQHYIEQGVIEIAPLAFMRGRTLNNAFVILDEAQNATEMQLKMFLTRMGDSAKFLVTGDITQIDLPKKYPSGLVQVQQLLQSIKGIKFIYLNNNDIVRHSLVQHIINAYNKS